MKRFRLGQRVRVTAQECALCGKVGTVERLRRSDNGAWVTMDEALDDDMRVFPATDPRADHILLYPTECEEFIPMSNYPCGEPKAPRPQPTFSRDMVEFQVNQNAIRSLQIEQADAALKLRPQWRPAKPSDYDLIAVCISATVVVIALVAFGFFVIVPWMHGWR